MKILIKNGHVIDPSQDIDSVMDILIDSHKISQLGKNIKSKVDQIVDATGMLVMPGLIDMHVHLREPGEEDKETIASGANAALYGGFTTICAMPNTQPPCDNAAQVKFILDKAKQAGFAHVLPIGTITKKREGKELSEMRELKQAGCIALSDDGEAVPQAGLLRRAMEYASMFDLLIIEHCEDKQLSGKGVMHEGYWSTFLGLQPISAESESLIVDRDVQLAELTSARLHIAHVSTAKSIDILRQAKKRGVNVTAEVTPHHFTLTDEDVKAYDTRMKVKPPLRSKADIKAIIKGLKDGTIDAIATDHAPHFQTDKEKEFDYAPFGMIGLETALSLALMRLVEPGYLSWPALVEKMAFNPARILNLEAGTLQENAIADLFIFDPVEEWIYSMDQVKSQSKNSPFIDWKLRGKVKQVFIGGKRVL